MKANKSFQCWQIFPVIIVLLLSSHMTWATENAPFAQLSSGQNQTTNKLDTQPVRMEQTDGIQGLELATSKQEVIIKKPGTYFVMAAGQVGTNKETTQGHVDLWLVQNGKPIPNSNTRRGVTSNKSTGVLVSQAVIQLKEGDKIGSAYAVSEASKGLGLVAMPATKDAPAIPSIIFTIFKLQS